MPALKYWNGSAWVAKALKYWTGSTWVEKVLRYWDGDAWLPGGVTPSEPDVANYANAGGTEVSMVDTSDAPFDSAASGSTFVIWVAYNAPSTPPESVFDNKGNEYTLKLNQTSIFGAWEYVCESGVGGAGHYATVDIGHSDYPSMHFVELVGVLSASYDSAGASIGPDSSSPFERSTGTLTQADEIILSLIAAGGSGGVDVYEETSGFTVLGQVNNSGVVWPSALAYKVVSATTSVTASWTITNGVGNSVVAVAGFKSA